MLDLKWVVENRGAVEVLLANRGGAAVASADASAADIWTLDARRRELIREVDGLRHRQKEVGKEIAARGRSKEDASDLKAEMKGVSERHKTLEDELEGIQQQIRGILLTIPNAPDPVVPVGPDETANREIKKVGEPRRFDFKPEPHWDLGPRLGLIDFERGAQVAGARFTVSWDAGARLERALGQFMLDLHTRERGYREVAVPFLANADTLLGAGQLPKFEADLFRTQAGERPLYLIPTAEVPLVCLHAGEILDAEMLPLRYAALTSCFRSEAGSYGKDVRGLIRQHQFQKVELVKFTAPEESERELDALLADAEEVLKRLDLPYRVVLLSTGDMGFSAAKTYDVEVWLPGQEAYREISSCSNCTDFQARRADVRYRPEPKAKPRFVHTLNGSGLALGRTLIAVLENYQQADGSVTVPEALRPYMDGRVTIPPPA